MHHYRRPHRSPLLCRRRQHPDGQPDCEVGAIRTRSRQLGPSWSWGPCIAPESPGPRPGPSGSVLEGLQVEAQLTALLFYPPVLCFVCVGNVLGLCFVCGSTGPPPLAAVGPAATQTERTHSRHKRNAKPGAKSTKRSFKSHLVGISVGSGAVRLHPMER